MRRVLIVGAGIGGDSLAVLLDRAGWNVQVVEIANGIRSGGQTVDLRGPSTRVLDDMGLLEQCRARLVPQRGIAWVDASGEPIAQMPVEAFGGRGFVSQDELLRTDLATVIHESGSTAISYRFGDTIVHVEAAADAVTVHFRSGDIETFDLVVGADGTHSRVRSLLFGPEQLFRRPLGLAHAWFTLNETSSTPALHGWFKVHNASGSRVVEARPGHSGQQEIGFTFAADQLPNREDIQAQHDLLERTFSDVGWRSDELLQAARVADDFSLDTFDQIHMNRWVEGRVVLLGDSAWCASPLSGLGTSLALQGAATLANQLNLDTNSNEIGVALDRYEVEMRSRVESAQKLIPGRVRMYAPRTRFGIHATAALMRAIQIRPVAGVIVRLAPAQHKSDDAEKSVSVTSW